MLTAASVHDSQVAIPLATITAAKVTNLYDLMDSAYDDAAIKQHSRRLNHVPIIDINPRATPGLKQELEQEATRQRLVGHRLAEDIRYGERSTAERVNGGLKDNHGGRTVRVRGGAKVMCHLMFGVLSFTALQLLRLVTQRPFATGRRTPCRCLQRRGRHRLVQTGQKPATQGWGSLEPG